jgi:hypothetical protein
MRGQINGSKKSRGKENIQQGLKEKVHHGKEAFEKLTRTKKMEWEKKKKIIKVP